MDQALHEHGLVVMVTIAFHVMTTILVHIFLKRNQMLDFSFFFLRFNSKDKLESNCDHLCVYDCSWVQLLSKCRLRFGANLCSNFILQVCFSWWGWTQDLVWTNEQQLQLTYYLSFYLEAEEVKILPNVLEEVY